MSDRAYPHILSVFMGKPWAILPEKLAQLAELIALRVEGGRFTDDEIAERISAEVYAAKPKRQMNGGGVAVVPIYGVITPRADMFTEMSGGTSMNTFIAGINQAANDPQVSSILLEIDSPGGQVDMVPEAAAAIRSARSKKPVTAVANTMAASAAYWLGSQASEFVVSPSAEVGSVGVFAAHNDMSKAMEAQGVKTTLITAGKYKTELSPYEPLSEEARANVQATVDEYYSMFTKDIAAGRRTPVSSVRNGFGEGRMLTAEKAVAAGMADRVDTFENTLGRMLTQAKRNGIASAARAEGFLTVEEIRAAEELPMLPAGESDEAKRYADFYVNFGQAATTSSSSNITITSNDLWPQGAVFSASEETAAEEAAAECAYAEKIDAESDRIDAEPQESFADMRARTRKQAMDERAEYLSLLRRITQ